METMIRAEHNAVVGEVHVRPGTVVSANGPLIDFAAATSEARPNNGGMQ